MKKQLTAAQKIPSRRYFFLGTEVKVYIGLILTIEIVVVPFEHLLPRTFGCTTHLSDQAKNNKIVVDVRR